MNTLTNEQRAQVQKSIDGYSSRSILDRVKDIKKGTGIIGNAKKAILDVIPGIDLIEDFGDDIVKAEDKVSNYFANHFRNKTDSNADPAFITGSGHSSSAFQSSGAVHDYSGMNLTSMR